MSKYYQQNVNNKRHSSYKNMWHKIQNCGNVTTGKIYIKQENEWQLYYTHKKTNDTTLYLLSANDLLVGVFQSYGYYILTSVWFPLTGSMCSPVFLFFRSCTKQFVNLIFVLNRRYLSDYSHDTHFCHLTFDNIW
jgi:hypothetical protein